MASNRIKGITIEIGGNTTNLEKSLKGVDSTLWTIQKDLKAVESQLKLDPGNVELLAQKQRLLAEDAAAAAKRFEFLSQAVKESNKALAEGKINTKQYNDLGLEADLAAAKLKDAERALSDFTDEMSRVDGPAGTAAAGIEDLGDAAEASAGGLSGIGGAAGGLSPKMSFLDNVMTGAARTIGEKLVKAAMELAEWLWSLDEATEEYREAMGKLNTAFEVAGFDADAAKNTYTEFYKILGDTDTATEASQLLAKLAEDEEDLSRWTEIAAGVYGTFGDSLPIEGLIEAANETAKTGKVTGVLADALNWAGINEDEFNKQLEFTSDAGYRSKMIMNQLTHTYKDAAAAFYENNEALMNSREVQAELDESMAVVGEAVQNLKTQFMGAFGEPLSILLNGAAKAIEGFGRVLDWLGERIQDVANFFRDLFDVSGRWEGGKLVSDAVETADLRAGAYSLRAVTAEDFPHLAQGTVTRPNSPFMAVVGDNPNEPEVISPLSTIRQAVREAVGASGGAQRVQVTVNFTGTLAPLVRQLHPLITAETARLGPQL